MDLLFNFFPNLPWTTLDIAINVIAALGAILITYAIFLEAERRQDAIFTIGGLCLLVYAIWIGNKIFMVAMSGFTLASLVELIEIILGRHVHSKELIEEYKHPKG